MGDSKKGENVRAFFPVTTKSYLTLLSLYISRSSQHKNGTHFNREHCRRVGQADGVFDQTVRSRSFREISEMLYFFYALFGYEGQYSRASAGEKGARRARERASAFGGCFEGLRAQKRANIARLRFFLSRTDVSRCLASVVLDNQSQISDRPISRFLNGVLTPCFPFIPFRTSTDPPRSRRSPSPSCPPRLSGTFFGVFVHLVSSLRARMCAQTHLGMKDLLGDSRSVRSKSDPCNERI